MESRLEGVDGEAGENTVCPFSAVSPSPGSVGAAAEVPMSGAPFPSAAMGPRARVDGSGTCACACACASGSGTGSGSGSGCVCGFMGLICACASTPCVPTS